MRGALILNGERVKTEFTGEMFEEDGVRYRVLREHLGSCVHEVLDDPRSRIPDQGPVTVPEGRYYFLGDNRDNSSDSRSNAELGVVHQRFLIGRAEAVLFSLNVQAHPTDGYFWAYWNPFRWDRFIKLI